MLYNPQIGDVVKANDSACNRCLTCRADFLIITEVGTIQIDGSVSIVVIDPATNNINGYWSFKLNPVENAVNDYGEW